MIRLIAVPFCLIPLSLAACNGSKPTAGGNVTMRDMEVVDGTANDSMADLDNATGDGTLLSNAGGLPGAVPMGGSGSGNATQSDPITADNGADVARPDRNTNAAAPE